MGKPFCSLDSLYRCLGPHISFPKIGHFHFFQEKRRVKTVLIDFDRIESSVFFSKCF